MSNIFFSSDHHINHNNIIKYSNRPFANVDEMNEALVENHNKIVKPKDLVFFLGDFLFTKDFYDYEKWIRRFNGNKVLILGNHDNVEEGDLSIPTYFRIHEWYIEKGHLITLSHFPQLSWNKSHFGSFNLHGHHHGNLPFDPKVRRMDVGVDCNNFTPFEWSEIKEKLNQVPMPELTPRVK
jgi:calcineurin-like phosphoesterase family protein